ncbi:hypothetical protein ACSBR1_030627 [Camellia fascicularis]
MSSLMEDRINHSILQMEVDFTGSSNGLSHLSNFIGLLILLAYDIPWSNNATLNVNEFTRPMPKDLGKLLRLQDVQFSYNKVQHDLITFISLEGSQTLEYIVADDNLLRGSLPDSIANLSTHISYISIRGNQFHGRIPSGIGNLLNFTVFDIVMSYLTGPIPVDIGKLSKLQGLYLQGNNFIRLPSSLGNLTSLNILLVGQNTIHGSLPPNLANCRNLLELRPGHPKPTLNLSHNNLCGSIPPEIMNLSSISKSFTLCLFHTHFPFPFSFPFPFLLVSHIFHLAHNSLTDSLPSEVGSLKNLRKLDVSNSRLSGRLPNSLSNCLSLEYLYLGRNSFEGQIPQSLRELKGLRGLELSYHNLSGLILSYLGELQLEKLNLSFNFLHWPVSIQEFYCKIDCPSSKSNENKLSYKMILFMVILFVVIALVICATLLVVFFIFLQRQRD